MRMRRERTRRSAGNAETGGISGATAPPATQTRKAQTSNGACACARVFDRKRFFFLDPGITGQEMEESKLTFFFFFFLDFL